ncbi:MAG: DegT/DnrJ/EryC1/StrS family aminotransferase [Bacillota bacterium]|nr:DegT/DnrJ/EryC1/StrS family aminotransferase [Bacillota bacterium]
MDRPRTNTAYEYEVIRDDLFKAIDDIVRNGRKLVLGHELERTEEALAGYTGRKHAVGVGNGTDAIYVALRALGVGPGDEVLMPANVCVAVLEAVVRNQATPHFVDVKPDTWTLDPAKVSLAIGPRTRAILAVHAYGLPADIEEIMAVAGDGVRVIECCGQAFGARYMGHPVGHFGTVGCFSFNPSKVNGAIGDGGALVTDSEDVARNAHRMRDHGRDVEGGPAHFTGFSSRLDEINSLAVRLKLEHIDDWIQIRHRKAQMYRQMLAEAKGVILQTVPPGRVSSYQMFTVRHQLRDRVRHLITEQGVRCGTSYRLPFRMPAYATSAFPGTDSIPETFSLEATTLSFSFFTGITEEQMGVFADALKRACTQSGA